VGDLSTRRLICPDALGAALVPDQGSPPLATAGLVLMAGDREPCTEIGLWEAGPGTDTDVEGDEVFVVLSGAGRIGFEDGSAIDLRPGVVVRLHAGDRTTWEVTERLRKLYLC
jgi:hypothetical protein